MDGQTRRHVLATGGAALTAFAGCLGGSAGGRGGESTGEPTTDPSTRTAGDTTDGGGVTTDGQSLRAHPSTAGIETQPTRGSLDADVVVVAFEDPSCPRCAAFERQTVPRIREELVAPGDGAFVVRTVPIVYPWGRPAVFALEATFARDPDAFFRLFDHYLTEQSSFSTENVLDRTRTWLSEQTGLDADAVVADAADEEPSEPVETDLAAADAAGVAGTPTVFLFRDGEYVTRATGSVSWALVRSALGR
jgi:protein-disulfide isomerase